MLISESVNLSVLSAGYEDGEKTPWRIKSIVGAVARSSVAKGPEQISIRSVICVNDSTVSLNVNIAVGINSPLSSA